MLSCVNQHQILYISLLYYKTLVSALSTTFLSYSATTANLYAITPEYSHLWWAFQTWHVRLPCRVSWKDSGAWCRRFCRSDSSAPWTPPAEASCWTWLDHVPAGDISPHPPHLPNPPPTGSHGPWTRRDKDSTIHNRISWTWDKARQRLHNSQQDLMDLGQGETKTPQFTTGSHGPGTRWDKDSTIHNRISPVFVHQLSQIHFTKQMFVSGCETKASGFKRYHNIELVSHIWMLCLWLQKFTIYKLYKCTYNTNRKQLYYKICIFQ